ncbi:hypothetical protein SAMN06265377_2465 [Flagellimonas pacifica]|uniref:Uncharacterized protein n=1 Tax=Flagellimonas pacifica TaxID=1247520 RepID=A0A285MTW2_9FLAO|nr:hypothetical protein SAMN06265377_2465 [Allomuricauda parva]
MASKILSKNKKHLVNSKYCITFAIAKLTSDETRES